MGLAEVYQHYFYELADPRTNNWWLLSSPLPLAIILASYLYFVLVCGPRYMRDRKPYSLKTFLTSYNIFQIFFNSWLNYKLITAGWLTHISLGCEPVDYSMAPMALQQAHVFWWTLILKLIDLSETAVFVLRKKDRQISFLHLYHHISTPLITWLSVKYFAGGMCGFPILVNNGVHIVMYTYYLLSARGQSVQAIVKFIKPYITIIQMVQFCVLVTHASQAFSSSCNISSAAAFVYIGNLMINLYLFTDFYRKNYKSAKKTT